jgi:hypothetical protein
MRQTNKKTERVESEYSIIYDELLNVILNLNDEEVKYFSSTKSSAQQTHYSNLFQLMRNGSSYSDIEADYSESKNLREHMDYLKLKLIQHVENPNTTRIQELQEVENAFHLGFIREGVKRATKLLNGLGKGEYWIKGRLLDLIYDNTDGESRAALDENVINSYYSLGQTFKDYSELSFEGIIDDLGSNLLQHLFKFREESKSFESLIKEKTESIREFGSNYSAFNKTEGFTYDTSRLLEFFNRSFELVQLLLNNNELMNERNKTLVKQTVISINMAAKNYKPASSHLVPNAFTLYMEYLFHNLKCSLVLLNGEIDVEKDDFEVDCSDINVRIQILNTFYEILTFDEFGKPSMKLEKAFADLGSLLNLKKAISIDERLRIELKCCYVLLAHVLRKMKIKKISGTAARFKTQLREDPIYAIFEGRSHLDPDEEPKLVDHVIFKLAKFNKS